MNTEDHLFTALEGAVKEEPQNKSLHRAIGSVINRFFKSKSNFKKVAKYVQLEDRAQTLKQSGSIPSGYEVYKGPVQKKSQPSVNTTRNVVGSAIDETLEEFAFEDDFEDDFEEELDTATGGENEALKTGTDETDTYETGTDETGITIEEETNEFLNMTDEQYLKMYGSLANLKKFANETLGIPMARTLTLEKVVELIKNKIREQK